MAAFCLLTGCETESVSDNKVRISPESAAIGVNESVTLNASGGFDYSWSLSNSSLGVLSTRSGPTTVYTSRSANTSTNQATVQVVTVVSSVQSGGRQSGTNTVSGVAGSAEAYIEHR